MPASIKQRKQLKVLLTNKIFVMKKYLSLEMSKSETIAFVVIMIWIIASCFVPLPEVNSLGA
jgi:hypothetical protein